MTRRNDPDDTSADEPRTSATEEQQRTGTPQPATTEDEERTDRPSFSRLKDDPLATWGTGGSDEPKGRNGPA